MINYLKVVNVGGFSYQLHFKSRLKRTYNTFKFYDETFFNSLVATSDEYNNPKFLAIPFLLLKELDADNHDLFYELFDSLGSDKSDSLIEIEFYTDDHYNETVIKFKYQLVFNKKGIVSEKVNNKDIRVNANSRYLSSAPQMITQYFNNFIMYDFSNEWKAEKHYIICCEMFCISSSFREYVHEYLQYLNYSYSDMRFNSMTKRLDVKYSHMETYVSTEDDEELKKVLGFCTAMYSCFIKQGVMYVANIMDNVERTLFYSFIELLIMNEDFHTSERANCQYIIQDNHSFIDIVDKARTIDRFDGEPVFYKEQIIKVTKFLENPIVEWTR
jgi:hypothetical protein